MFLALLVMSLLWVQGNAAHARDVVLVLTPGFSFSEHLPIIRAIQNEGHRLHVVGLSCAAPGFDPLADRLREKDQLLRGGYSIVAHGLGATLVLGQAHGLRADEYLLLGPLLQRNQTQAIHRFLGDEIHSTVELKQAVPWRQTTLQRALFGPGDRDGCLSIQVARTLQRWFFGDGVALDLAAIRVPVWIGTSLGDEFSPVESLIPLSHQLPRRQITRFGLNRFDAADYSHAELLMDKAPTRTLARQIGKLQ